MWHRLRPLTLETRHGPRVGAVLAMLLWSVPVAPSSGTGRTASIDRGEVTGFLEHSPWTLGADCSLAALEAVPHQFQLNCLPEEAAVLPSKPFGGRAQAETGPVMAQTPLRMAPGTAETQQVPESPSGALAALGLATLALFRRRRTSPAVPLRPSAPPGEPMWKPWVSPVDPEQRVLLSLTHHWLRKLPRQAHPLQLCLHFPWTANHLASVWHRPVATSEALDELEAGLAVLDLGHARLPQEVQRLRRAHLARLAPLARMAWPAVSPELRQPEPTAEGTDWSP